VIELLQEDGAEVVYHDPHVPEFRHRGHSMESVPLTDELFAEVDLVVVLTDHAGVDYARVVEKARHVLDTRNACRKVTDGREKVTLL
jgi:UDP-N-acetyl-D-glucosamine dehydrogenase